MSMARLPGKMAVRVYPGAHFRNGFSGGGRAHLDQVAWPQGKRPFSLLLRRGLLDGPAACPLGAPPRRLAAERHQAAPLQADVLRTISRHELAEAQRLA